MKGLGIGHQSGTSPYESPLKTHLKKKNTKKIINSNKENVNWKLTIVNKHLILSSTLPSP